MIHYLRGEPRLTEIRCSRRTYEGLRRMFPELSRGKGTPYEWHIPFGLIVTCDDRIADECYDGYDQYGDPIVINPEAERQRFAREMQEWMRLYSEVVSRCFPEEKPE